MRDTYNKADLTVIALALTVLAVRPIVEPRGVGAQGPTLDQMSQRLDKIERNAEVMRSAGNTNAHQTNVRFAKQGWGVDVVLADIDAAGVMGPRSEPAIQTPAPPPEPVLSDGGRASALGLAKQSERAFLDELHQGVVPNRTASAADVTLESAGR
jgi:hypothetical protein